MANLFLNLPMPAGNGAGASVDTSAMGEGKTLTIGGEFVGASITVEVSTDGGTNFQPVATFTTPGSTKVVNVAAQFMRVNVQGRGTTFTANLDVSANDNGGTYLTLPLPVGDGTGAAVDISALGSFTTAVIGGSFEGASISIEVSGDGVAYTNAFTFSSPGAKSIPQLVANFARTVVVGTSGLPFTPTVGLGGTNDGAGGVTSPLLVGEGDGTASGAANGSLVVSYLPDASSDATASGDGSAVIARASTTGAGAGSVVASGPGSFARGSSSAGGVDADIVASYEGAFAGGAIYGGGNISALYSGSFAHGNVQNGGTIYSQGRGSMGIGAVYGADGQVNSSGAGALAVGRTLTFPGNPANVTASGEGAIAVGRVGNYGSALSCNITAGQAGASAFGFARENGGTRGNIQANSNGSHARGLATGSDVTAGNQGSTAIGHAEGGNITASGEGAFAVGHADGADIAATAQNSFQFGIGSNALADSLQVGTAGIRFKGTSGAPAAPQNGDMWIDGTDVIVRSGGVNVTIA